MKKAKKSKIQKSYNSNTFWNTWIESDEKTQEQQIEELTKTLQHQWIIVDKISDTPKEALRLQAQLLNNYFRDLEMAAEQKYDPNIRSGFIKRLLKRR
jgi:hypothetical protein